MIIRKDVSAKQEQKEENNAKKVPQKKVSGLGRGLDSLLEDNSPTFTSKTQMVNAEPMKRDNSLYRKDGAMSYVKTPKSSGS